MSIFDDFIEVIGPDTPILDGKDTAEARKKRGGRPNKVFGFLQDAVHLIGPDTPLMGGNSLEEERELREQEIQNKMKDEKKERSTVTVQIVNPYDGNLYRFVEISMGSRVDLAASMIASELGLREQSQYELIYFDRGIPVSIDPEEFVRDYWHMSKIVLQVKPVRPYA